MDPFSYNDGGRAAAGFKGPARDCVTRAIAIAAGLPYMEVYEAMNSGTATERQQSRRGARTGIKVQAKWFKEYMGRLGFVWVPTMKIGQGCTVHLRADELPRGRLVVNVSKHSIAVIDGVVHDTHDSTRGGTRCVYGYWKRPEPSTRLQSHQP